MVKFSAFGGTKKKRNLGFAVKVTQHGTNTFQGTARFRVNFHGKSVATRRFKSVNNGFPSPMWSAFQLL